MFDFRSFSYAYVCSLTLAAGLMFTPDMLSLYGSSLGTVGWIFVLIMPVAVGVHLATVQSFQQLHSQGGGHFAGLQNNLGRRGAAVVALSGKLPFAVCASAALAVTAGFLFNEVFVYWFPNFAFAFLLLGAIAAVNLVSRTAAQAAQIIGVSTACIGLIVLCGASLSHLPGELGTHDFKFDVDYRYLAATFVVLIGYDLGLYVHGNDHRSSWRAGAMVAAVVGGAVIVALWGLAAMTVISPEKLESSTVPHMTLASRALGQAGRYVMGTVAIAAVCGAINAMMHSVGMMAGELAKNYLKNNPKSDASRLVRPATVVFIAGASAALMALGFAGEAYLETWIRAGIILWMLYYTVVNITAIRTAHRRSLAQPQAKASAGLLLKIVSIVALSLAATGMILAEPEPFQLLMFAIAAVTMLALMVNLVDFFLNRSKTMRPRQQRAQS